LLFPEAHPPPNPEGRLPLWSPISRDRDFGVTSEQSDPPTKKGVQNEPQSLTLANDEWHEEDYPNVAKENAVESGDSIVDSFHETIQGPDSLAIDKAKALVQRFCVLRVENQNRKMNLIEC
jgi:hypothetical protein